MKVRHVLVPLDQSGLSEAALEYARSIIYDEGEVTLLYVVEPGAAAHKPVTSTLGIAPLQTVITPLEPLPEHDSLMTHWEGARLYLERIAERLRSPHRTVHYVVREGHAAEQIVALAEELRVDAIIMATHGRSGLSRLVMGSVASKVVSDAPCPVFLIPQKALRTHRSR